MRQSGGAEEQSHAEGDLVPRVFENQPGREEIACDRLSVRGGRSDGSERGKEFTEVEIVALQHKDAEKEAAAHEQDSLDDLHPCCGKHAAEDDVNDHEDAHADHREFIRYAGDKLSHEDAGADHLGDHVKDGDCQCAQRSSGTHRSRLETVSKHVGHGVFPGIAQRFGHDEKHSEVGDEEADRIHKAVVAVHGNHARDAEKAGCTHVVASHGESVLPPGDAAAGREVGTGSRGFSRAIPRDDQRGGDKSEEHPERGLGTGSGEGRCGNHLCSTPNLRSKACSLLSQPVAATT